jgi:hypothetical protein
VGSVVFGRLVDAFETPERVFRASQSELGAIEGIRKDTVAAIASFDGDERAQEELARIKKSGLTFLTIRDKQYPALLKTIYDPPPFLYVKGEIREQDNSAIRTDWRQRSALPAAWHGMELLLSAGWPAGSIQRPIKARWRLGGGPWQCLGQGLMLSTHGRTGGWQQQLRAVVR